MPRDCYASANPFVLVPMIGTCTDPVLMQLVHLFADDTRFQAGKAARQIRFPRTFIDGCPSPPVEVILRLVVVKHPYIWSYEHIDALTPPLERLSGRVTARLGAE